MMSDMILSWLSRLPDTLTKSAARLPVGRKAAAMFNSCVTQDRSGVKVIKDFMYEHGLAWPENQNGPTKPLEALFDLSFNWRVHLWLRLNVLAISRNYNRRLITVSPNDILALWWQVFRQIPEERFKTVYTAFYAMFAKDTTIRPRDQEISKTQKGLKIIFNTFLPSGRWNARTPSLSSLRELDSHSFKPMGEEFMRSLNSALRIDPPVTMDDLVLMSDDAILEGTFALIANHSERAVINHLSWLFMQACAVVADPARVLVVLHGDKRHAVEQRPRFCARQVEDSYKLMVSAMASVAHFNDDERRRIDAFLAEIRQMALNKTLAVTWLDNATSQLAAKKLKNVEAVLWPAEKFLTARGLHNAYAQFPESGASFANFWVESRRRQRSLFGTEAGVEEQRISDSMAPPYVEYVHGLNKLSLSIGALAPPLYYPHGTKAMLYGGLGYFYAKGLVEAIDDDGIRVDPAGKIGSSWLGEAAEAAFMQRTFGCLPGNARVFPQIPAIELAFAAFKRHPAENNMQISEELTEEKVFFISVCLLSCRSTSPDGPFGSDCNKAVMNFAPFAEAFSCPPGSRMNLPKTCTFFDR
ncbi:endothelin-converting enzyme 1-like [Dermacentor andersoni]|uniref:endothelin-converting enzyme 1-like n=1 Tax=Dermacentor andersoni TaxID=34620 RepID=UPI0024178FDB|nr:endothelin-converting enzyme 1-like [Dermacentor andersoni]